MSTTTTTTQRHNHQNDYQQQHKLGEGIHYATPTLPTTLNRTTESDLVRSVLLMIQSQSTTTTTTTTTRDSLFKWDPHCLEFRVTNPSTYLSHLSLTSLHGLLRQFTRAATCLRLVDRVVVMLEARGRHFPTLRAFASSVSHWVQRLRDLALKEEMKVCESGVGITPTLMGLSSSLSSLCSGAEYLLQIVHGAIPQEYFEPNSSIQASEMAVHVLDYLYKKLDEVCLVQGGEEDAYLMVLHIFVGSLLPNIQCLDSWLFEGTLNDPFEELFFFANKAISINDSDFWEKSYQLRQVQFRKLGVQQPDLTSSIPVTTKKKEVNERDTRQTEENGTERHFCPLFIKDVAKSIVSAGKSLQLIRHVPKSLSGIHKENEVDSGCLDNGSDSSNRRKSVAGLTLSEIFCLSVAALVGHGNHFYRYLLEDDLSASQIIVMLLSEMNGKEVETVHHKSLQSATISGNNCFKYLVNNLPHISHTKMCSLRSSNEDGFSLSAKKGNEGISDVFLRERQFCPENPVVTVCQTLLDNHDDSMEAFNFSGNFDLPALNDEVLRDAVFGRGSGPSSGVKGTDYALGFQFAESEYLRSKEERKSLEALFPFPTMLPFFQDDICISEMLPFQNYSTLPSRVLRWIQSVESRTYPLPAVIVQQCLSVYIQKQVDYIGGLILSKLMNDWRLMDELAVLRAIYLLGSGDLLQHFLTVIFSKLDKGETWDDEFELNLILQESICNSADAMLLGAPDSLFVAITKNHGSDGDYVPNTPSHASTPRKSPFHSFGLDIFDSLNFTYKVSWPLELIANPVAIRKYNQVMRFLLKVKRAKYVLDKARKWMWKGRGTVKNSLKRHWLVEQKLLHFVDAFHQYVMDRVYRSAWHELCEGVATARSLDEVMEVHEAYLLSIHRQCFVVPDKLWALIASRINSILELALQFHSLQQTLSSSGATSAMKARCEMEVDRIEKQFDECVAFLLRILSFKLNVGNFPHLADLVTRINYNYFYMSDGGTLKMATGSDAVTSRLGKAFVTRAD